MTTKEPSHRKIFYVDDVDNALVLNNRLLKLMGEYRKTSYYTVEEFRDLLKDDRAITLYHGDHRYKANDVSKVIFPTMERHNTPRHSRYLVRAGGLFFFVQKWERYIRPYFSDEEYHVESFTDRKDLLEYLQNQHGHKDVIRALEDDADDSVGDNDSTSY